MMRSLMSRCRLRKDARNDIWFVKCRKKGLKTSLANHHQPRCGESAGNPAPDTSQWTWSPAHPRWSTTTASCVLVSSRIDRLENCEIWQYGILYNSLRARVKELIKIITRLYFVDVKYWDAPFFANSMTIQNFGPVRPDSMYRTMCGWSRLRSTCECTR